MNYGTIHKRLQPTSLETTLQLILHPLIRYEKDNKKGNSRPSYDPVNMLYDSDTDSYQCTLGRKLIKTGSRKKITENGYEQQYII
jgi:hypothetical protein